MSFRGRMLLVVAVAATCAISLAQDANLQAIECPFPEGQEVVSEEECGKYSACEWTDGVCHVVDNAVGGYVVQGPPEVTTRGFKVNLKKADDTVTMFGDDVTNLVFEVIQHEDYHLQVKIYDADAERYEVPVPLSLPDAADAGALYTVNVSGEGEPFDFVVSRKSNNNTVFRSLGPLTFEDQFLQLHTSLASTYLYGFGENTHLSFRHTFEPRSTFPIFARDQPVGTDPMNEYGHHPYYMVMEDDEGNSHSVLLYNSNAMEYSTFLLEDGTPALTLRTIGGIIDLHMFLGPLPEDLITQYTSVSITAPHHSLSPSISPLSTTLSQQSRNHNTNGTPDQDPGVWPEVGEISRYTLNIRYQYLPYLYYLFHRAHMFGNSVVRPLLNVFPSDLAARDVDDQFMWGDGKVLIQGATSRDVYFPKGIWYDLVTGVATATGPTTLTVDAPLEVIPLYVPGGAILPYQVPGLNTVESRQNPLGLTVALDGTLAASGEIFWDDGEGEHDMSLAYMSMLNYNQNELTMSVMAGEDIVAGLFIDTINIYGFPSAPQGVSVNDMELPGEDWEYDASTSVLTITTHAPLADPLSVFIL
nr:sucrase-isomaltase, intestinal-like [Procambarus clarkii]